jgi:hypothetical protein
MSRFLPVKDTDVSKGHAASFFTVLAVQEQFPWTVIA